MEKIVKIYKPYKKKIKYILCGHLHSFFEDQIHDIPLLVTGGVGARIEFVNEKINKMKAYHHILKLSFDNSKNLIYNHI